MLVRSHLAHVTELPPLPHNARIPPKNRALAELRAELTTRIALREFDAACDLFVQKRKEMNGDTHGEGVLI
jgi:hypothetical protein